MARQQRLREKSLKLPKKKIGYKMTACKYINSKKNATAQSTEGKHT